MKGEGKSSPCQSMCKKEEIFLDAVLGDQIDSRAFRALLSNGHELVAHCGAKEFERLGPLGPGQEVQVCMSPYDMSIGRICGSEREVK